MTIAVTTRFLKSDYPEDNDNFLSESFKRITKTHPEHDFIFIFDRQYDKNFVFAKAFKSRYGPIRFNEVWLTHNNSVLYLLQPDELKDGRRQTTDCNWSPQIYHIRELMVQKINQSYID